jgi:hypothetical protein
MQNKKNDIVNFYDFHEEDLAEIKEVKYFFNVGLFSPSELVCRFYKPLSRLIDDKRLLDKINDES